MASVAHTPAKNRLAIHRLGLWLFILSESFLFIALLSTRYYLQGVQHPAELNQALGLAISIILVLSSLTAYRAETFAAYGNQGGFRRNTLFTMGLGTLFLVGVGIEWFEAFHFFPPSTGFGTVFFTLTGFHAFHVLTGLMALAAVLVRGRRVLFGPANCWGVEGAVKYWHFVDVAWVFIYPMRMRQRDTAAARRASPLTTLHDGLRYVAKDQTILALILISMIPAIFIFPFTSGLMPVFAKDVLHAGPEGLGLLLAVLGVGGLLGALTVATLGRVRRPGLVQLVAGVVSGLGMVIFSQAHSIAFAVPFLILVGTTQMLFNAINNTAIQMITPDAYRGRVMSFYMMNMGLTPVGSLIAGTVAQFLGSPASVLIGGILTVGLVVLASIRFRTMRYGT